MNKSRFAIILLVLASLTAVGFSSVGAKATMQDDCSTCTQGCDGCCHQ